MKPAQVIQVEKQKFERIVSDAATKFADETGGAIASMEITFIDTRHLDDVTPKTVIGKIDVHYIL